MAMRALALIFLWTAAKRAQGFTRSYRRNPFSSPPNLRAPSQSFGSRSALAMTATSTIPSWSELQTKVGETTVGRALNEEAELRAKGLGAAHVDNTLRVFDSTSNPELVLYRDKAGWCPYCQKMMLLVEEKKIPVKISTVPMRSYGDKPASFMRKVPNGLLPAMEVNGQIITESSVIMELLDRWHSTEDGYLPMMPKEDDEAGIKRYERLFSLERQLFSWWCTLLFRPEGGAGGTGNFLSNLMGGGSGGEMSASMEGFLDCMQQVDKALRETKGPWFFDEHDHPTMIDFIYVSHVERMLASCAFWKGLDLRDPKWNLPGVNAWLEAFEKREAYLGFKSDYYTHIKDIPPQYGPGYSGGFGTDRESFSALILGKDDSWNLPLSHDDPLQPLYRGPPLPLRVLNAVGIDAGTDGSYEKSASAEAQTMADACRLMAAWKLAGNGENVSKFAARGGPKGSKNPRKTFGAELADPYADPDLSISPTVDAAIRVVCTALASTEDGQLPDESYCKMLIEVVPANQVDGVVSSMAYLRDRVGVPRDLPLAAARYFRAYLNWGIKKLSG